MSFNLERRYEKWRFLPSSLGLLASKRKKDQRWEEVVIVRDLRISTSLPCVGCRDSSLASPLSKIDAV